MSTLTPAPPRDRPATAGAGRLASFLSVLQLTDSAFPSGRYTLSYGLETLVQSGRLAAPSPPATLVALLTDNIRFGVAPSDGVALACAHRAARADGPLDLDQIARADERLTAVKLSREGRDASTRTGRALLDNAIGPLGVSGLAGYARQVRDGHAPGNHAVVLGALSARLGVPCLDAVTGELYAFAASWVAAAVRLSVTDHRSAVGVLHRVRAQTVQGALRAVDRDIVHISSCTPLLDTMAMRHEQTELRLFAS